jgi:hypothetical protein
MFELRLEKGEWPIALAFRPERKELFIVSPLQEEGIKRWRIQIYSFVTG